MSTSRGIFESFPNQTPPAGAPSASPFGIAADAKPDAEPSPAAPAGKNASPFSVVSDERPQDEPKTSRLPERRKANDSPFQISEPQGFGFEAPQQSPQALKASPFESAQFSAAPLQASPFQMEQAPAVQPAAPSAGFGAWPQAEVAPSARSLQFTPAAQPAPSPQQESASGDSGDSDSYSIKQIELRAIFGVDREMTNEEIVQRSRSLPGIRQIARVNEEDISAVDALKKLISNLGFGSSPIKLYSGSVPIEFIREGKTLLAVQTDGGFAPGVRETLMLVARELGK